MRVQVTHNTAEIRRRFAARAAAIEQELTRENAGIADLLTKTSKEELQRDVYDVPVKTSRSGRLQWVRTGVLKSQDHWEAKGLAVRHVNHAAHFPYRLRYGKPGGQIARPPQKASDWVGNAVRKNARKIAARRRAAIARAWRRG